jgi:CheY-like chemotaxis protein
VIVKRIAALMGGNAGVDSAKGEGSRFWLDVRLGRAKAPTLPAEHAGESAEARLLRDHRGARVLLAEDEQLNREMALELLQAAGLSPESATNGREAVRMVEQREYALVLMDANARNDGPRAARAIRAVARQATRRSWPSTSCFGDDRRACEAAGMNDFIAKPLEPEQLYATVLKWLERD